MLELVDGADSKSVVSNGVWVRVPLPAPKELNRCTRRKTEEINCKRLFFFLLLQMFIIGLESDIIKKLNLCKTKDEKIIEKAVEDGIVVMAKRFGKIKSDKR